MIIIRMSGGLGNQMQQYALYRKLQKMGKEAFLDVSLYDIPKEFRQGEARERELDYFSGIRYDVCLMDVRDSFVKRSVFRKALNRLVPSTSRVFHESKMYHPEIFALEDAYLYGYFHCQKYYGDIMDSLREEFVFPVHKDPVLHKRNQELIVEMAETPSVSLHLRRGDYVTNRANEALFGGIATDAYYDAAIRYFREKEPETVFYVFTNDPAYARARFGKDPRFIVVDWNRGDMSLLDLQLMSACRGNICANSTFSVWGARLNRHTDAVRLRTLRMKNGQAVTPEQMQEYWPGWILMDSEGHIVP